MIGRPSPIAELGLPTMLLLPLLLVLLNSRHLTSNAATVAVRRPLTKSLAPLVVQLENTVASIIER
jgi:hypothetical protein